MIKLSPNAKDKLQEHASRNPGLLPRISFATDDMGDFTGPALKLAFERPQQGDLKEEVEGFPLVVAEDVSCFAQQMIVDYVSKDRKEGFEIEVKISSEGCSGDCASCQACSDC